MAPQCNHEITEYSKIFKDTYWGNFQTRENYPRPEIVNNRNDFIKEHDIVAVKFPTEKIYWSEIEPHKNNMDHVEFYRDKIGRVVCVYSSEPGRYKSVPGYEKIKPIYAVDQDTMIRKYETPKSKRLSK
jgi:hypothetical protein